MKSSLQIIYDSNLSEIFNHFYTLFGIRMSLLSSDFNEVYPGERRPVCTYCSYVQQKLGMHESCLKSDREMCLHSAKTGKLLTYHCHAGLLEAVKPLVVGDLVIGYILFGQYRTVDQKMGALNQRHFTPEQRRQLNKKYKETLSFTQEQLNSILGLLDLSVDQIIVKQMVKLQGNFVIEQILSYLKQNPDKSLSLKEGASLTGKSASYLSHLFSDIYKKSFTRVMMERKIERAEKYMREGAIVKIAAYKAGFQDPLYFSRIYKKVRGYPPTAYKR